MDWRSLDVRRATPERQRWVLLMYAAAAMAAVLWFFSPRYALWPTIDLPAFNVYPETHRAWVTLQQLKNPFLDVDHFSNKVLEWRLLFPVIFHYLHLPTWLFLALPWIGCLLVLWYAAALLWKRTQDLLLTIASLVTLATLSWFFTSTGWLTYFDSWYVLGGLILAFSASPWLVLGAAVLTPWIDERIVFMLPVCLAARLAIYWSDTGKLMPDRRELRVVVAAVAPLVAYTLIRLAATIWFDEGSQEYVAYFGVREWPLGGMALGAWMGLRLAWVPVLLLPVLLAKQSRRLGNFVGIAVVLCAVIAVVMAGDISRSMSILAPVLLASLLLLPRLYPNPRGIVIAVAVGNLILPAAHIIGDFALPIFDARLELDHLNYPPQHLDPSFHLSEAMRQYRAGDLQGTVRSLEYANVVSDAPDELASAIAEFGQLEENKGHADNAAVFYRRALDTGSAAWSDRSAVERRLAGVKASTP